ncbi:hypothetical protein [Fundidesulfovibrio terrae]|uniref:hypothetical protein n=1 Tax=Fundidesulfovibrio terrae TaxID=2922866 RepID=UPI001FAEDFE0|nr:hypothetical protein [Fundidesulfovibrio terrae]
MILIATPCYNGTVHAQYMISLFNMVRTLGNEGVASDIMTPSHESLITRARNFIANEFVRHEEYSHLLFIDSDLSFPADTALRYLRADKDIVCGVYPLKYLDLGKVRSVPGGLSDPEAEAASLDYTVKFKSGEEPDDNGFMSVEYGSTGFMLIKRRVFVEMARAHPELRYKYSYAALYDHVFDNYAFFDTLIDPDTRDYLPEDYSFCKRWTALGGEVHADMLSRFAHIGSRVYQGDYPRFASYKSQEADGHGGG